MSEFDLNRAKGAVEQYFDSDIFIIAGNLKAAKYYREGILQHTNIAKKSEIQLISNYKYALDGRNFINSIVFLCGYWWQNRNALKFMKSFIRVPKLVIPITHIPPLDWKGGDNNEEQEKT